MSDDRYWDEMNSDPGYFIGAPLATAEQLSFLYRDDGHAVGFVNWNSGDMNVLDGEIEAVLMAGAVLCRQGALSAEVFWDANDLDADYDGVSVRLAGRQLERSRLKLFDYVGNPIRSLYRHPDSGPVEKATLDGITTRAFEFTQVQWSRKRPEAVVRSNGARWQDLVARGCTLSDYPLTVGEVAEAVYEMRGTPPVARRIGWI